MSSTTLLEAVPQSGVFHSRSLLREIHYLAHTHGFKPPADVNKLSDERLELLCHTWRKAAGYPSNPPSPADLTRAQKMEPATLIGAIIEMLDELPLQRDISYEELHEAPHEELVCMYLDLLADLRQRLDD